MIQGRYDEALKRVEAMEPSTRVLKFYQYKYLCTGLIKVKRAIRRYVLATYFAMSPFPPNLFSDTFIDTTL
jgi:hypothetical protein